MSYDFVFFEWLQKYIDLARAKSEALVNIYSLLKPNIKSGHANQAVRATETAKKKQ